MLSFRLADSSDCLLIQSLASKIWEHTYGNILSKEQVDYMFQMMYSEENLRKQMNELHHLFFIIEDDSVPCAYCSIERKGADLVNFQKIYALPTAHKKGIGRFMIENEISWVKKMFPEVNKVELYVNRYNKAVDFYKHMGFSIEGTRDHSIGNDYYMNDYIMTKKI